MEDPPQDLRQDLTFKSFLLDIIKRYKVLLLIAISLIASGITPFLINSFSTSTIKNNPKLSTKTINEIPTTTQIPTIKDDATTEYQPTPTTSSRTENIIQPTAPISNTPINNLSDFNIENYEANRRSEAEAWFEHCMNLIETKIDPARKAILDKEIEIIYIDRALNERFKNTSAVLTKYQREKVREIEVAKLEHELFDLKTALVTLILDYNECPFEVYYP